MPPLTHRSFRRFAPAVLAGALAFVALADPGAQCLAAWICAPRAEQGCEHGRHAAPSAWERGTDACGFASQLQTNKADSVRFDLRLASPAAETLALAVEDRAAVLVRTLSYGRPEPPPGPPLHQLHATLLI